MAATACGGGSAPVTSAGSTSSSGITLNGAGATFPYPLYAQWAHEYGAASGVKLNYQSIGSGGGIAQIKAKTVDFGASDAPLKSDVLDSEGLIQFPMVIGGVVPVINVEGISSGQLKLTGTLLADIFLGKIRKWNDPSIASANPGLSLPDQDITVVHRADGSGTTWIFTNFLSAVSESWKSKSGSGTSVEWPSGVGGKGNEGVSSYVERVKGSIGYVEFAYALQNKMAHVLMENRDRSFVEPSIETFQSAAANADWANAPGYYLVLVDQPGARTWPITGASFILMHREQPDAAKALAVLKFFDWAYKNGEPSAKKLDYVSLPGTVADLVRASWTSRMSSGGKPVWSNSGS
ncbi:MAG: phosphate ABC transporter substrate-binding protein PstS [Candidatus Hydrogenedentota bacterium]